MFRDYHSAETGGFLLEEGAGSVDAVLLYVRNQLNTFPRYYMAQMRPQLENRITDLLVGHLMTHCTGFEPYFFSKNPTQEAGNRESDIGVFLKDDKMNPFLPILEIEAKRFSVSANNHEYVYGRNGGIERFKRKLHSPHLFRCSMVGYVLDKTPSYWLEEVNRWISHLATVPLSDLDWTAPTELLTRFSTSDKLVCATSENKRIDGSFITMSHFFVHLNG